ncbi:unnamed protein product, partial [Scytosiphon promiscuus]
MSTTGEGPTSMTTRTSEAENESNAQATSLSHASQTPSEAQATRHPREREQDLRNSARRKKTGESTQTQVPQLQEDELLGVLHEIANGRVLVESRIKENSGTYLDGDLKWFKECILELYEFKAHAGGRFRTMQLERTPSAEGQPSGSESSSGQSSTADTGSSSSERSVSEISDTVASGLDERRTLHQHNAAPTTSNVGEHQTHASRSPPPSSLVPSPQQAPNSAQDSSFLSRLGLPLERSNEQQHGDTPHVDPSPGGHPQVASAAEPGLAMAQSAPTDHQVLPSGNSPYQGSNLTPLEAITDDQLVEYMRAMDTRINLPQERIE